MSLVVPYTYIQYPCARIVIMRNIDEQLNGVIISRRNMGEADRLLTVFTKEKGKVKISARSARKIKSRLAPHIEPYTAGKFQVVPGKTFYILTGAESKPLLNISKLGLEGIKGVSYLCELLDLTYSEEEPNGAMYDALTESISAYNDIATDPSLINLYFEYLLLCSLGYRPNFGQCKKCHRPLPEAPNYSADIEGAVCSECDNQKGNVDKATLKLLRLLEHKSLAELRSITGLDRCIPQAERLIQEKMTDILPRKPRSLEL